MSVEIVCEKEKLIVYLMVRRKIFVSTESQSTVVATTVHEISWGTFLAVIEPSNQVT